MKKELTKEEIHLLARVQKTDVSILMSVRHLLDTKLVRSKLIMYEYKERVREKRYNKKNIIEVLMKRYGVSKSYIELIIYNKRPAIGKECVRCGRKVSFLKWNCNDGVCDECIKTEIIKTKSYDEQERDVAGNESPAYAGKPDGTLDTVS